MAKQSFNEINITPLTDIFLVLLIIMMVIAPMLDQQGINLAVPEYVEESANLKENKILRVAVTVDNKYITSGKVINADALEKEIRENIKNYPDGLMIEAQSDSAHGAVVKLMDIARNSGVTNISITEIQ
ncbi:MAG: biopolymer transporter ExbD [Cyanobacteria bacterium SIG30]|nr:biopolymer transporter ExbD [Cyanobacteria bacterium SIG30]